MRGFGERRVSYFGRLEDGDMPWEGTNTPMPLQTLHVVIQGFGTRREPPHEDVGARTYRDLGVPFTFYTHARTLSPDDIVVNSPDFIAPNRGDEAHGYLRFIVEHYDHLPEYVAFVHGGKDASPDSPALAPRRCFVAHSDPKDEELLFLPFPMVVNGGEFLRMDIAPYVSKVVRHPWFKALPGSLESVPRDTAANLYCCAHFVASRKTIQRHSRAFWRRLYSIVIDLQLSDGRDRVPRGPKTLWHGYAVHYEPRNPGYLGGAIMEYTWHYWMTGRWSYTESWASPKDACDRFLRCEFPECKALAQRTPEAVSL